MAKLTDRQRKQIIAEYVNGDGAISQQQLADRYKVSRQAISKILNTTEGCERLLQKKEENTLSMLEFMEGQKSKAQNLMQKILDCSEKDIRAASLRDKMGALKILHEVFGASGPDSKPTDNSITEIVVQPVDASEGSNETDD